MLTAGQILDVIPGSPLEAAIGPSNLTTLSAAQVQAEVTGSDSQGLSNA